MLGKKLKFNFYKIKMKQYKIEVIKEGVLGTLFLGSSKLPVKKIEEVMNQYGKDGWDVSFQVIEKSRMWLFWEREALIVTFVKDI